LLASLVQLATFGAASGKLGVYLGSNEAAKAPTQNLNRALAAQIAYSDDFQWMASPLLGSALTDTYVGQALFCELLRDPQQRDVHALADRIADMMQPQGKVLQKDGAAVGDDAANRIEIRRQLEASMNGRIHLWQQLGML
ncbi:MAG TPA: hypothetical protein VIT92_12805, partial [Burkholderiaceae bacterium]